jgi:hypothetical protein
MPRRTLTSRLVAIVLAALLGLTGPGASLAHGVAHVREHRGVEHTDGDDHHALDVLRRLVAMVHGHEHDETHDLAVASTDEAAGAPVHEAEPPSSSGDSSGTQGVISAPDDSDATHRHPRLDALTVTRLAVAAFLPAAPTPVPSLPVIAATVEMPPAATPLRLAEPPTGPPPPSRAPPHG